ncbi:MAG: acetyl-CoA carboxylase carboxyl transferase subunit alpha [Flavobacteriales bacterium]|jgi:acetyl-CoA carboxylase carboxyl transferase subunit alpha|tara:strand:+ start:10877 stop:11836 length:960 start_codon:yes stop_codon:yes gene_type:complete
MVYLDFEQPIAELNEQLEKIKEVQTKGDVDVSTTIKDIEKQIAVKTKEIYENLSAWQQVQVSRHPQRPYTLGYIDHITDDNSFIELHGDRNVGDDKAMVGGMGSINGESVMFIGQQKGINTKMRQYRNFGMPNPEGYRKALRLMKMAEKFNIPVVCLIDTPGAFPGLEAEERGQGEAIARNLIEMAQLKVSLVCVVIGEGASGGALGIGMGDKVFMMENTWYSVISPENCSTILWRSWDHKEEAAEKMKLTSQDMLELGLIDGVIKEPVGGAHADPEKAFENVKNAIIDSLNELRDIEPQKRVATRIKKFSSMGHYEEA